MLFHINNPSVNSLIGVRAPCFGVVKTLEKDRRVDAYAGLTHSSAGIRPEKLNLLPDIRV